MLIGLASASLILNAANLEFILKRQLASFHKVGQKVGQTGQAHANKALVEEESGSLIRQAIAKSDTAFYDWLMQRRGPHNLNGKPGIDEVVIVSINENTIKSLTKDPHYNQKYISRFPNLGYPFPRSLDADLIRKLKKAGASVIGLDMVFSSPSGYNQSVTNPDDDREFAHALKECGNVVLTTNFKRTDARGVADFESTANEFPINIHVRPDLSPDAKDALILDSARSASPANIGSDILDQFIRRFQPFSVGIDVDDPTVTRDYLSFAPMLAALYWNNQQSSLPKFESIPSYQFEAERIQELKSGKFTGGKIAFHQSDLQSVDLKMELPPDPKSREEELRKMTVLEKASWERQVKTGEDRSVRICYAGYPGSSSCKSYNFEDVLDTTIDEARLKEWFDHKIVIVGSFLADEHDEYNTPLSQEENLQSGLSSRNRFGVEVHASIVHTLLSRHYYKNVDERLQTFLVWFAALLTAGIVLLLKPIRASIPILVLIGVLISSAIALFDRYSILQPTQIFASLALSYLAETVYFYGVEDRRARRARNTFNRYVGPKVLATVLDTDYKQGTVEKRYATILFSDVQGFTSLAEKIDPKEAVLILNRYLDQMVDIIFEYEGVLDKIMGDGVMAYFNAPSDFALEDHEQKATLCALKMQEKMIDWRKVSEAEGLPPLKIRIGIHSGEVIVGEMGAKKQLGFTVIGDAVNTAARLEPLNKEFGSEILISEAVKNRLDSTILTEYKGELEIRGRKEGIRAYSVTGRKHEA